MIKREILQMTVREQLVAARSHIVFVAALLVAFGLMLYLDRMTSAHEGGAAAPASPVSALAQFGDADLVPLAAPSPLSETQREWARVAWRYFENNIDPTTGLANSVNGFPSTTMWDTGSFLAGMISARRLGLIDTAEFDRRMSLALASLAKIELFDGVLPNKAYDTRTLRMVDYVNRPSARGLGWSAIDIARLLVSLTYTARAYPEHASEVEAVISRFDLARLASDGVLVGTSEDNGETIEHQEGRVGYEQYAARMAVMAGLDAFRAWQVAETLTAVTVEGTQVPVDKRGPLAFVTSEPYLLYGLDFGFDAQTRRLADAVYRAQEARFAATGTLTAVSEGHIDQAPYFTYATVWANDVPWAVVNLKGERFDALRTLSTKTAFAWDALYHTPYSARLVEAVASLRAPDGGWLEGRYEASGEPDKSQTANTNGIVLASLAYRVFGPLLGRQRSPNPTAG